MDRDHLLRPNGKTPAQPSLNAIYTTGAGDEHDTDALNR